MNNTRPSHDAPSGRERNKRKGRQDECAKAKMSIVPEQPEATRYNNTRTYRNEPYDR
jgi:hypothetical protein